MFEIIAIIKDSNGHRAKKGAEVRLTARPFTVPNGGQFWAIDNAFHCSDTRAKGCINPIKFIAIKQLKEGTVEVVKEANLLTSEWNQLIERKITMQQFQAAIISD